MKNVLYLLLVFSVLSLTGSFSWAQAQNSTPIQPPSEGQPAQTVYFADHADMNYLVLPNITYTRANNTDLKLDVYLPNRLSAAVPTVMLIHGGGWVVGVKEGDNMNLLPWLAMGWAVVNVDYRLASVSPAPAAVEDCRCALRWIIRNAGKYKFDSSRIVVVGGSAGGHLALMTGMLPSSAGFDAQCPADDAHRWDQADKSEARVAAIVNFFGITDVDDMLAGPNARGYAIEWIGGAPNAHELARRVSPLTYVRAGLPPIITLHGDADKIVPFSHALRLHQALDKAGVQNKLVILHEAGHGDFNGAQVTQAYDAIREFLAGVPRK